MSSKGILTVVLLVFVAGSVAFMAHKELTAAKVSQETTPEASSETPAEIPAQPDTASTPEETASLSAGPKDGVVAYYFHTSRRCVTCKKLESQAKAALDAGFAKELAAGTLRWEMVNIQTPETEHFVEDYELVAQAVVLVEWQDGKDVRHTKLDRIWELVHDGDEYDAYIRDETTRFLKEDA